jgi:FAD/FMN-containing dehydrogenase
MPQSPTALPKVPAPIDADEAQRAGDRHAAKLERVVRQLRDRSRVRPVSLKKRAVSHLVPKPRDKRHTDDKIDIGDLDEILGIDPVGMTCTAEPGVTFTDLVDATLRHGLVPIIVPELRTITIGGAVAGCSIESMSFKYGGFHDTCLEYELITATGEVLRCTPDNEHRLIFQMVHGSFGTLGILSRLRFRLIAARPYVHITYEHHPTLAAFQAAIWRHFIDGDTDFMDGIIHSPTEYALSLGRFVEEAPYTNRYDWTKVYYRTTAWRREDYLETPHYFFRYDNGVTNVHPRTALGRLLFGKFLHSAQILRLAEKLHRFLPSERPDVTVDVFIPMSRFDVFMDWYREEIGFFPVWCVPYRRVRDYEWISPEFLAGVNDPLFVDLAIYGMKQRSDRNVYKALEDELLEVKGLKTLISYNYYDEEVFWRIWNKANYLAVKKVTDPHNIFRDLYSKTCRAARGLDDGATSVAGPR